ncbi:MAG: Ig-like domain-containing protein [candidate division Zixibacteria bacterium]|nr:Ig-like domain-containing protein [candidate division Zixibacteria bacterium]
MRFKKTTSLLFSFITLFLSHCAKEGMPPGGAVDTTPPEVISISPQSDSTGVDLDSKIEITFSERMSGKPTQESIFISPFSKKPFDYKWRGNRLILSPTEPLLKDKTYVVTIGTGAQDLRRNHLSESYTFAFSTGAALDYGSISGEVWMKQEDKFRTEPEVSIWAYLSCSEHSEPISDTIEIYPQKDKPDYVTQSDTAGKYVFRNLSVGKYRLLAVEDLNRDQIWNPDKEAIGVSTQDVELTSDNVSQKHVDFILALRDTTKPSFVNCQALNKNQVRLDFDENLKAESVLNPDNFKIKSISASESLKINEVYFQEGNTQNIFILIAEMNPEEKYELKVSGLKDESGNPLDTGETTCLFVGSAIFDTTGPKIISTSPEDGKTTVPQDAEIKLLFDEPPGHPSVESNFSFSDSSGVLMSGKSRWENPNTFIFSLDTLLLGRMKYQIKLGCDKVLDLFGNAMTDSVLFFTFITLNPDTLGSLSGLVLTFVPKDSVRGKARPEGNVEILGETTSKKIVVTLSLIDKVRKGYKKSLPQLGPFLFENILPGKYMVGAYLDLNGDGNLTIGNPKPFILCEPFTFFPDTVHVRSRWETEGVELKFR